MQELNEDLQKALEETEKGLEARPYDPVTSNAVPIEDLRATAKKWAAFALENLADDMLEAALAMSVSITQFAVVCERNQVDG